MEEGRVTDDEELEGGSGESAALEGCSEEVAGSIPDGGGAPVVGELDTASGGAGVVSSVQSSGGAP